MMRENEKESVNISLEFDISLVHGFNLLVSIIHTRALWWSLLKRRRGNCWKTTDFNIQITSSLLRTLLPWLIPFHKPCLTVEIKQLACTMLKESIINYNKTNKIIGR